MEIGDYTGSCCVTAAARSFLSTCLSPPPSIPQVVNLLDSLNTSDTTWNDVVSAVLEVGGDRGRVEMQKETVCCTSAR